MIVRKIRLRTNLLSSNDESYFYNSKDGASLIIPRHYVYKTYKKSYFSYTDWIKKKSWTILLVDSDFFSAVETIKTIAELKSRELIYVYDRKKFGIDWDRVSERLFTNPPNKCFYCQTSFKNQKSKKTKDHLIPKLMLKAYGIRILEDNTVPCCEDCNKLKSSLHPYTFREYIKTLIKTERAWGKKGTYIKILEVLNDILIGHKDAFK